MYRLFRAPRGLRGKLFKLTGPIFLETLLMLTLGVVDTLMLSHHSDNAVAAVGVVNQLLNMVFLLFNITTTGTSVMCALYFGAKDHKSFIQVLGTSLLFNAGIGCLISLMLFLFGKEMLVLMDIRPDYANVEVDGNLEQVDPDEVEIGTIIVVQPGEKVPIDGIVTEGKSTLNTSALTGESVPRDISVGEEVISGCINLSGVLKIQTTKEFGESTVSKILDLEENSSSKKSKKSSSSDN